MKLKVFLEKGETEEDVEEFFEKAAKSKQSHAHEHEFPDPTVEKVAEEAKKGYDSVFQNMLKEIKETLEDEENIKL